MPWWKIVPQFSAEFITFLGANCQLDHNAWQKIQQSKCRCFFLPAWLFFFFPLTSFFLLKVQFVIRHYTATTTNATLQGRHQPQFIGMLYKSSFKTRSFSVQLKHFKRCMGRTTVCWHRPQKLQGSFLLHYVLFACHRPFLTSPDDFSILHILMSCFTHISVTVSSCHLWFMWLLGYRRTLCWIY